MGTEMIIWGYSLLSVFVVSLVSLIGIFAFFVNDRSMCNSLLFLVSFSAGSLLGGAFLHLIPEVIETAGFDAYVGFSLIAGILAFFVLEKFIHWRHCHVPTSKEHPHPFAYTNLVGDAVHNLIDGLVIGAAYIASVPVGISTTLAMIAHEIPQEIGDFGVLIHGGFSKKKALALNFLTALTAVVGTVISLSIGGAFEKYTVFMLPFAAGGFIYIAGADLIPELHKETAVKRSFVQFVGIVLGVAVMYVLRLFGE